MSGPAPATVSRDARGPALALFWWAGIPSLFSRVSASVFAYLLDGVWVFAFRPLASVATPLALVIGLIIGTTTAGYEVAPFESIVLICLIVAVGTLSGHLGLAVVTGLATGDFFLAGRSWTIEPPAFLPSARSTGTFDSGLLGSLARDRLPLLIGYGLLAAIAVGVPVLLKGLLSQLRVPDSWPQAVTVLLSLVGHVGLTWFVVDVWVEATPVLIRPMWTWPLDQLSARPTALALVQPLQQDGSVVVAVAAVASAARIGLQWHVALDPRRASRISSLQERLRSWAGAPPMPGRLRRLVRVAWRTMAGTLLLAGIVASTAEAVVLTSVLLAAGLVQSRVIPVPMGEWPQTAARIPLLVRLVAAIVLVRLVIQPLAGRLVDPQATTFRTFLVVSVLAMLIFVVLLPARPVPNPAVGKASA